MPKKMGVNDKKEEAREREASKKSSAAQKKAQDAEDAHWDAAGANDKSKAQAKKEEEGRKRQEQAAKRAELKRLQEEEEAALVAQKKKLAPAGAQKVTRHQLETQAEMEARLKAEELREKQMAARRELDEDAYAKLVSHQNTNRLEDGAIDARSVEGALAALGVTDTPDKHPEKRLKASYKAFEERQLAELKQDKPGLKMSQYKDMVWKLWQKSPDNPMNQPAAAGPSK